MGLCLEVDCEPLVLSKRQWKQVAACPRSIRVNATVRPGAFSLQASPLDLQRVVALSGTMNNPG
jgi:hypothetical protein